MVKRRSLQYAHFKASEAPALMAQAWRLRHRVFNESLGWQIPDRDLLEIDEFDLRATHAALLQDEQVAGYVRALPTTGPYLLGNSFSHLLDTAPPSSPDICEISRFAVDPARSGDRTLSRALVREGVALALEMGATTMIAVTEPPFERFLQLCGLQTQRLCPPRVVGKGRSGDVHALVISCDVSPHTLNTVGISLPAAHCAA